MRMIKQAIAPAELPRDLVPLQDAVQTVAGDVAALQALGHKTLQKRHFEREKATGSHPGGRRFEPG
jgi:hypothetical protein